MKPRINLPLIVSLSCLAASSLAARSQVPAEQNAQATQSAPPPFQPTKRPFKRDTKEFQVNHLKSPPELPFLPPFPLTSGTEFACGQLAPNTLSGQIYTLTYYAKESGENVLNWYDRAFKGGPWTVTRIGNMIQAEMNNDNGVRCNIFLLKSMKPAFKTSFVVLYTIPPPRK